MKTKLTKEEIQEILKMKEEAQYLDVHHNKMRYDMDKLAAVWIKYIDYLDLDYYLPRHFNDKKIYPLFKEILFSNGERSKITRYLKEKKLITVDSWKRHVVNWREKGGKKHDSVM